MDLTTVKQLQEKINAMVAVDAPRHQVLNALVDALFAIKRNQFLKTLDRISNKSDLKPEVKELIDTYTKFFKENVTLGSLQEWGDAVVALIPNTKFDTKEADDNSMFWAAHSCLLSSEILTYANNLMFLPTEDLWATARTACFARELATIIPAHILVTVAQEEDLPICQRLFQFIRQNSVLNDLYMTNSLPLTISPITTEAVEMLVNGTVESDKELHLAKELSKTSEEEILKTLIEAGATILKNEEGFTTERKDEDGKPTLEIKIDGEKLGSLLAKLLRS